MLSYTVRKKRKKLAISVLEVIRTEMTMPEKCAVGKKKTRLQRINDIN